MGPIALTAEMRRTILYCFLLAILPVLPYSLRAGEFRVAVIPAEFSDIRFEDGTARIESLASTAASYFNAQFSPSRSFSFTVLEPVRLRGTRSRYFSNSSSRRDTGLPEALSEACTGSGADFSLFDGDGDGFIDAIYIVCAGKAESEGGGSDAVWPQQGFLHDRGGTFTIDGKTADCFAACAESSTAGIFCHELAHAFGLCDLYDTDGNGSGGLSPGVLGSPSLMDGGTGDTPPNFCALEIEQLGLASPIAPSRGYHTLRPLGESRDYIRIGSDTEDEYFLLECRSPRGWDSGLQGEGGLLIYHIDRSANDCWYSDYYRRSLSAAERWSFNQVNCRPDRQCARILPALSGSTNVAEGYFPYGERDSFGSETDPAFRFRSGATSDFAITGITRLDGGRVGFNIIVPLSVTETHPFQDAAIIVWTADETLDIPECSYSWYAEGDKGTGRISTGTAPRQNDGNFYAILEGLQPQTGYTVVIRAVTTEGQAYTKTISLQTKSVQKGARPFIYLKMLSRRPDGSYVAGSAIPMRVYNAIGAKEVRWHFNGMRMHPESDGQWHLTVSGTLTAEVYYDDGSVDIICKKMTVK